MDPRFACGWLARSSIALRSLLLMLVLSVVAPAAVLGVGATLVPPDPVVAPGLRADLVADGAATIPDPGRPDLEAVVVPRSAQPSVPKPSRSAHASAGAGSYSGRNHVWSSALGLDRSVAWFPCSRSRPPGMAVYRWGCAGANNIYLFAHAGGPFQRLHDIYVRGKLRRGMTVTYADARGRTATYRVAWWKVVLPTNGEFAFAAQSRDSMTLQTCVGANDRYRLVVRLYRTH